MAEHVKNSVEYKEYNQRAAIIENLHTRRTSPGLGIRRINSL